MTIKIIISRIKQTILKLIKKRINGRKSSLSLKNYFVWKKREYQLKVLYLHTVYSYSNHKMSQEYKVDHFLSISPGVPTIFFLTRCYIVDDFFLKANACSSLLLFSHLDNFVHLLGNFLIIINQ